MTHAAIQRAAQTLAVAAALALATSVSAHEPQHQATPGPEAREMHGQMGPGTTAPTVAEDPSHEAPRAPDHEAARVSLVMPIMNSERGMRLFASKGCVICHSVNGVGGHIGKNLDTSTMLPIMDPFDFAAKMWTVAPIMIETQEQILGHQLEFTGAELADLVAFTHDYDQQRRFTEVDIPLEIRRLMPHLHGERAHQRDIEPVRVRLAMPMMDSERGMRLFASRGCVTCHAVNGVGGEDAAPLDAHTMPPLANPFDFAAKMWTMAPAMIPVQKEALRHQVHLSGRELADIIAFVHDDAQQHKFSQADIPPEIMPMMRHMHGQPGGDDQAHGEEHGHMRAPGDAHGDEKTGIPQMVPPKH